MFCKCRTLVKPQPRKMEVQQLLQQLLQSQSSTKLRSLMTSIRHCFERHMYLLDLYLFYFTGMISKTYGSDTKS